MTEFEETKLLAEHILNRHSADPDDELAMLARQFQRSLERLAAIRTKLEEIVCTVPPDDGVVLLSDEGPTDWDEQLKVHVYRHEHFSPLGDALMEVWKMTGEQE